MGEANIKEGKKIGMRTIQIRSQYQQLKAEVKEANRLFQEAYDQADALYGEHRTLARLACKNQPMLWDTLNLSGSRKLPWANWLAQVQQFYTNALPHADTLAKYTMSRAALIEAQRLVEHVASLDILRQQTKSQLQVLSAQKQAALKELEQWLRRFYRVAKVALKDEPQYLEALGLVVRA